MKLHTLKHDQKVTIAEVLKVMNEAYEKAYKEELSEKYRRVMTDTSNIMYQAVRSLIK
jgi:hypothetical protein